MSETKTYKKKLTDAGGAVCVLSFIALCLSAAGVMLEYIGTAIYNNYNSGSVEHILVKNWEEFASVYEKSAILAVFSFIIFITALKARNKKKIGSATAALTVFMPVVMAVVPAINTVKLVTSGSFRDSLFDGNSRESIESAVLLSNAAIPLFVCFFLLLSGLILAGRLIGEEFHADVPASKRVAVMPEQKAERETTPDIPKDGYISSEPENEYRRPDGAEQVSAPVVTEETAKDNEQQEEKSVCKFCGAELKDNAKFCSVCGKDV